MRRLAIGIIATVAAMPGLTGLTDLFDSGTPVAAAAESEPPATSAAAGSADDVDENAAIDAADVPPPVRVLAVSGLMDAIVVAAIDDALVAAEESGAQALILQMNSRGAVVSDDELEALMERIDASPVPVAMWVGPSNARLYGQPVQLLAVADVSGMSPGARIGHTGLPLSFDGDLVELGNGSAANAALRAGSLGLNEARQLDILDQRVSDEGIPTLKSMINALDGYEHDGGVIDTTRSVDTDDGTKREAVAPAVLAKLGLIDEIFHTVASPAVSYLLLLIGLMLLIFEFFTAGVGIAGMVGAGSLVLACTGLAVLPTRWWAVAIIVGAMIAFAVDVQVGIPRFWTGVGVFGVLIGSFWLFDSVPGANLRPSWLALLAGVGGMLVAFTAGMPSMVRTRFATPTIGREWLIGELGTVVSDVAPNGVVSVGDGEWRARTNRATPVNAGAQVRVVAIDGITLEVEPLEGAAKDYRER